MNKYLEKIAAKTLDEIDDDRRSSMRRLNYLPLVSGAAAPIGYLAYQAGKKTGGDEVSIRNNRLHKTPRRGIHEMKRDPNLRNKYLKIAAGLAAAGYAAGKSTSPYLKDSMEEKYRKERKERRKELAELRKQRKS